MIEKDTLLQVLEKYGLNGNKMISQNDNILTYGEYGEMVKILEYLINELNISQKNIEKCPSILYRNPTEIKNNVKFLKSKNIDFIDIESCLHVLGTETEQLLETYKYVLKNYGIIGVKKCTSILACSKETIQDVEELNIPFEDKKDNLSISASVELGFTEIEDIRKILQSKEYEEHPELFTSTTLAHAKIEDIQKMLQSEEYKEHPELFTSTTLANAQIEDIQKMLQSKEYKEHPELFTSTTLAHAKIEDIQRILQSKEYKEHPELFTSQTLAHAKIEDIRKILQSEEYKEHPELFTSETLAHAKLEDISKLLRMDWWKDVRFKKLLTSSIVAKSKSMIKKIPVLIELAEEHGIDKNLNTKFLLRAPSQNYALIRYCEDNNIMIVVDGKLNPIFGKSNMILMKKDGIDVKDLMVRYPFEKREKERSGGQEL